VACSLTNFRASLTYFLDKASLRLVHPTPFNLNINMKLHIYIETSEDPLHGFTGHEVDILRKFDAAIKDNWITNSNSTSNLRWILDIKPEEPSRTAKLIAVDSKKIIHQEPLYSLETKSENSFLREFINAAAAYGNS
jgi:hypothetical protein